MKQARAKQGVGENGHSDSGRGRACRSGVERMRGGATWAAGFQPPVEETGGQGRRPPLRLRRRQRGDGWGPETRRPGLSRERSFNCKHVSKEILIRLWKEIELPERR